MKSVKDNVQMDFLVACLYLREQIKVLTAFKPVEVPNIEPIQDQLAEEEDQ